MEKLMERLIETKEHLERAKRFDLSMPVLTAINILQHLDKFLYEYEQTKEGKK